MTVRSLCCHIHFLAAARGLILEEIEWLFAIILLTVVFPNSMVLTNSITLGSLATITKTLLVKLIGVKLGSSNDTPVGTMNGWCNTRNLKWH
jgi:hypothetical protein